MIKYSVIIPAYECEDTLAGTVKSILSSGLKDFEIIIVNDGSTDGTRELCDKLSNDFTEVVAIHQPNSGVSVARNTGIEKAKGEYILFMDSDDSYDEGALSHAIKLVEEQKPDMLIFGISFDFYKNDSIYRSDERYFPVEGLFPPEKWSEAFSEMFQKNALSSTCNKFFKSSILKNNKLTFNTDVFIMEDLLFVLDCLSYTRTIYMLPQAIYRYRQPDDSVRFLKRIDRIENLNKYLIPFYDSIENLSHSLLENYNTTLTDSENFALELYALLLYQKSYYADLSTLKKLSQTHKESKWVDCTHASPLLEDLKNGRCFKVYLRNKTIQLRHKVAEQLKKAGILG